MKLFLACLPLIFAASLAGCGATVGASDGAGYARLTPSAATRAVIVAEDEAFARQVAAHNRQCGTDPLCRK